MKKFKDVIPSDYAARLLLLYGYKVLDVLQKDIENKDLKKKKTAAVIAAILHMKGM
ncbi:hypothetical protein [Caminibacter mediatlanticus]|uniref:Uncharacterized protein n=1 Tax=Caminibacter mediatlanticus TB-2 TaxID=391592 RepID=A0AAI9AHU5_9BACT|nr:hypothetical protein [Caminibacter mediatlanticus]EDM23782.1 hypothetical protein CMTB2_00904 [Caminibacter mediatlanticus TB-2]